MVFFIKTWLIALDLYHNVISNELLFIINYAEWIMIRKFNLGNILL